jgi:hypothetical protein
MFITVCLLYRDIVWDDSAHCCFTWAVSCDDMQHSACCHTKSLWVRVHSVCCISVNVTLLWSMLGKGTGNIFLWLADISHLIDMFISYLSFTSLVSQQKVTNETCGINLCLCKRCLWFILEMFLEMAVHTVRDYTFLAEPTAQFCIWNSSRKSSLLCCVSRYWCFVVSCCPHFQG